MNAPAYTMQGDELQDRQGSGEWIIAYRRKDAYFVGTFDREPVWCSLRSTAARFSEEQARRKLVELWGSGLNAHRERFVATGASVAPAAPAMRAPL